MNSTLRPLPLFFLLFFFPIFGQTQIAAPDFQCVVNDSLFWEPSNNTCGPFTAYEVFASTSPDGPYTLLASIADPTQTFFYHNDANNQLWYYYLTSPHLCPGETVESSDTLDNLIPVMVGIESVSVAGSDVEISWPASPSPETVGYVISRNTSVGTTVLDTVYDVTTYLDISADPENQSEMYFVVALDACGNKSLVPPDHQTLFLNFTPPDACNLGLEMSWNPYVNWNNGVDRYEIYVGADGATPVLVDDVPGSQTSFTYFEGNDGETLCFYVEAVEALTDVRSRSSGGCAAISILQPLRRIDLLGASVNPDGTVDLEWFWDETALITETFQERMRLSDDVIVVEPVNLIPPLVNNNVQQDASADAQNNEYSYRISAGDECGNTVVSNESLTPFLTGTALADGNQLEWVPYTHDLATAVSYELVRLDGLGETVIFTGSSTDAKYLDPIDPTLAGDGNCYYLRVLVTFTLPDGPELSRVLRSNTVCLVPAPNVYVPNVFAPEGVNNIFRPQLSFGTLDDYEMNIYDRWGGYVFQSKNISDGWDGTREGRPMPQGVYLYQIRMTPNGNAPIELTGDVMLLR